MRVRVKVGTGPITWTILNDHTLSSCSMYAFLARFAPDFPIWSEHFVSLRVLSRANPDRRLLEDIVTTTLSVLS
jgi:hypothetical protein